MTKLSCEIVENGKSKQCSHFFEIIIKCTKLHNKMNCYKIHGLIIKTLNKLNKKVNK